MKNLLERIKETTNYIQSRVDIRPKFGIILGSGLGKFVDEIEVSHRIRYNEIPHFPVTTIMGHKGELVFGHIKGKPVVAMSGRFHYYEGYSAEEVTFPVRVMKFLGIELLLLSNAAGGLNGHIHTGDIVIIRDHINLQPEHPLRGKNIEKLGPRFPDMLHTYDNKLVEKGMEIAKNNNIRCHLGVYVGLQGPTLETPAEYKYLHMIGGDVVGMSTVAEVIVAKHMDLKVFAVSVCTDMGYPPEAIRVTTHEDVVREAEKAEPKLATIFLGVIRSAG